MIVFICLLFAFNIQFSNQEQFVTNTNLTNYLNSWKQLETFVSTNVGHLFNYSVIPGVIRLMNESDIDTNCYKDVEKYIKAISNMEYWAIKSKSYCNSKVC